jgi:Mg2+ and Co2+ transporter CorA
MNFFEPVAGLVNWTDNPAFYVMLAVIILIPVAMLFWMRKRGWL